MTRSSCFHFHGLKPKRLWRKVWDNNLVNFLKVNSGPISNSHNCDLGIWSLRCTYTLSIDLLLNKEMTWFNWRLFLKRADKRQCSPLAVELAPAATHSVCKWEAGGVQSVRTNRSGSERSSMMKSCCVYIRSDCTTWTNLLLRQFSLVHVGWSHMAALCANVYYIRTKGGFPCGSFVLTGCMQLALSNYLNYCCKNLEPSHSKLHSKMNKVFVSGEKLHIKICVRVSFSVVSRQLNYSVEHTIKHCAVLFTVSQYIAYIVSCSLCCYQKKRICSVDAVAGFYK